MSEIVKLTREQLYERVWAEPMQKLAPHYGISDVGLAKACKRLRVPVPGRGYWAKKAAGQTVRRTPLPALPADARQSDLEVSLNLVETTAEPSTLARIVREQAAFEEAPENKVVVRDDLRSSHPLLRQTANALRGTSKSETDFVGNYREPHLDIQVSRDQLTRALHVMNALVKAFEVRGWKISLGSKGDDRDRKSYVTLYRTNVPFGIRERIKKVENPPAKPVRTLGGGMYAPGQTKYRDVPSGRLSLVLRSRWGNGVERSFDDSPSQKIEDRLNEFIVAVVNRAYEDLEWDAGREDKERNWRAEEVRRYQEAQRRERELARIQALEAEASDWDKSERIRAYVTALRSVAGEAISPELQAWCAWAEQHATALNPLAKRLKAD